MRLRSEAERVGEGRGRGPEVEWSTMKELWVEDTGERNEWVTGIYPTVSWPLVPGVFLRGLRLEARVGCALEGVYFVQ